MNNFWFYWTMWGFWLIVAFFFPDGKRRTAICAYLLIVIAVSPLTLTIGQVKVNSAFLLFALAGCALLSGKKALKVSRMVIASLIVMMADVLAQIYPLYDPAILMLLPKWTFIFFMGILIASLTPHLSERTALVLIGMSQGEVLQSLVFYPYNQKIGDTDYLVTVSFLLLILYSWEVTHLSMRLLKEATGKLQQHRVPK